jgi:hypothetical protein
MPGVMPGPRAARQTPGPMLWILAGVLGILAVVGIGVYAAGRFLGASASGNSTSQSGGNRATSIQPERGPVTVSRPVPVVAPTANRPNAGPAATAEDPANTANEPRPEGFPELVPRHRTTVPNAREWGAATTVKMQPEGCFRKVVREWIRLNCSKSATSNPQPQSLSNLEVFGSANADYFLWVRPGEVADVVVRMAPGKRAVATMQLEGRSLQVGYDWSAKGTYPIPIWE